MASNNSFIIWSLCCCDSTCPLGGYMELLWFMILILINIVCVKWRWERKLVTKTQQLQREKIRYWKKESAFGTNQVLDFENCFDCFRKDKSFFVCFGFLAPVGSATGQDILQIFHSISWEVQKVVEVFFVMKRFVCHSCWNSMLNSLSQKRCCCDSKLFLKGQFKKGR